MRLGIGGIYTVLRGVTVLIAGGLLLSSAHAQSALFAPIADSQGDELAAEIENRVAQLRADETTEALELVRINLDALESGAVMLDLPELGSLRATLRNRIDRSASDFSWIADVNSGRATIVVQDGEIAAHIQLGGDIYSITSVGNGVHALIKIDPAAFPPDHPPGPLPQAPRDDTSAPSPDVPPGDDPIQVDVLVPYTTAARQQHSNITAHAQLAVDMANQAYEDSNAQMVLNLVGTMEVNYSESTNMGNPGTLRDLTDGTGAMAAVHTRRDELGADLVALLARNASHYGACGVAWVNSNANLAFSVTAYNCVSGRTFAHEIGHNVGASHDPYMRDNFGHTSPYSYGYGHIDPDFEFRTIMSYVNQCQDEGGVSCPRIGNFSNPNIRHDGKPTGTTSESNVARLHRERVATIANFRTPVRRDGELYVADFDGDGTADILLDYDDGSSEIRLMDGPVVIHTSSLPQVSDAWRVRGTGDFNASGTSDILWRHPNGGAHLWMIDGASVDASQHVGSTSNEWKIAGIGDFNGNGSSDILWRHSSGGVHMWLMDGATVVQSRRLGRTGIAWTVVGVGDLNGNGHSDIVWRHENGGVHMWLMDGATVDGSHAIGRTSTNWAVAGVGDFNGNGHSDIVWRHQNGGVHMWLMDGATVAQSEPVGTTSTSWALAGVGDFFGDGKSDIVWQHDNGSLHMWRMDGPNVIDSRPISGDGPTMAGASDAPAAADGSVPVRQVGGPAN